MAQLVADRKRFLDLVRHWHQDHPRPDQMRHCENVMRLLELALDRERGPVDARRAMILAALGHDLYEDSGIDRAQVATDFGSDVDLLIEAVTERHGVAEFVERVVSGPEEARLIKLCDGVDNYGSLVQNGLVREDPATWIEVVRRQMEPMFSRLSGVRFDNYPAAANWLWRQLDERREGFWAEVGAVLRVRLTASQA